MILHPQRKHIRYLLLIILVCLCCACRRHTAQEPVTADGETWTPPEWQQEPAVTVDGDHPWFDDEPIDTLSMPYFSDLDALGRCGPACMIVNAGTLTDAPRENRSEEIHPSGWQTARYDFIEDGFLYNRCHLIAYSLSGENTDPRNRITGTRYLNIEGMLPYEIRVADYVRRTGAEVCYRVTPVFEGNELLARGVRMEAESLGDGGAGLSFHVYVFNVQPGVRIDYRDGSNAADPDQIPETRVPDELTGSADDESSGQETLFQTDADYVINVRTQRFHRPDCESVQEMYPGNRELFYGDRQSLMDAGYIPCKICQP